jgi:SPP1 family predicted phage head-tail adaptor
MTDPGRLRHRLTLEAPVETPDDAGGVTRTFSTIATVWAALTPVAARPDVGADALAASISHRIVIRTRTDITTRHQFRLSSRAFRVVTLRERDDGILDIDAEERRD